MFPDEEAGCAHRVGRLWSEGVRCPRCDAEIKRPLSAMPLAVQRIRAGDHLLLFPRRWNYFREYE
jgi:hypothetical protein